MGPDPAALTLEQYRRWLRRQGATDAGFAAVAVLIAVYIAKGEDVAPRRRRVRLGLFATLLGVAVMQLSEVALLLCLLRTMRMRITTVKLRTLICSKVALALLTAVAVLPLGVRWAPTEPGVAAMLALLFLFQCSSAAWLVCLLRWVHLHWLDGEGFTDVPLDHGESRRVMWSSNEIPEPLPLPGVTEGVELIEVQARPASLMVLPPGFAPGTMVETNGPDGTPIQIVVPLGVKPGQQIQVQL